MYLFEVHRPTRRIDLATQLGSSCSCCARASEEGHTTYVEGPPWRARPAIDVIYKPAVGTTPKTIGVYPGLGRIPTGPAIATAPDINKIIRSPATDGVGATVRLGAYAKTNPEPQTGVTRDAVLADERPASTSNSLGLIQSPELLDDGDAVFADARPANASSTNPNDSKTDLEDLYEHDWTSIEAGQNSEEDADYPPLIDSEDESQSPASDDYDAASDDHEASETSESSDASDYYDAGPITYRDDYNTTTATSTTTVKITELLTEDARAHGHKAETMGGPNAYMAYETKCVLQSLFNLSQK